MRKRNLLIVTSLSGYESSIIEESPDGRQVILYGWHRGCREPDLDGHECGIAARAMRKLSAKETVWALSVVAQTGSVTVFEDPT